MTIGFNISLPYGWSKHRPVKWFSSWAHGTLTENKSWEWQTDYFGWTSLFNLDLDLIPTGSDHAGIGISLTILGFMVDFKIYDSRHWDLDAGTWEKYDPESIAAREAKWEGRRAEELKAAYELVKEDGNKQTRKSVEEFLESPQGQALIESKVKAKLEQIRQSKEAKRARGEAYRIANLNKDQDK